MFPGMGIRRCNDPRFTVEVVPQIISDLLNTLKNYCDLSSLVIIFNTGDYCIFIYIIFCVLKKRVLCFSYRYLQIAKGQVCPRVHVLQQTGNILFSVKVIF